MSTVSIHDAKAHLSALIARVSEKNERVIISRYGKAVAEIIPYQRGIRTIIDPELAQVKVKSDLTEPTVYEWENA